VHAKLAVGGNHEPPFGHGSLRIAEMKVMHSDLPLADGDHDAGI
jgi:hypothetical protein